MKNALICAMVAATCTAGCQAKDEASPATISVAAAEAESAASSIDIASLPERHRRSLLRAFENAEAGRSPTLACTGAVASAAGNPLPAGTQPAPEDVRAFELCYIDAGARYIGFLLAQITPATPSDQHENTCARIASYAQISRTSLGSFAKNIHLDVASLDARLVERVETGLRAKCPQRMPAVSGRE